MKLRDKIVAAIAVVALLLIFLHGPLYEALEWTWGGTQKEGRAESTGYLLFSGLIPCLALLGSVGYAIRRVKQHFECHVDGCSKRGHIVEGTPYRACHDHDERTEHEPGEAITPEHIKKAHEAHHRRLKSSLAP